MSAQKELKEKLIYKLGQEMKEFKIQIKNEGVDFAIDRAYELTAKQEIIDYLEFDIDMTKTQIKSLIEREKILDELYADWLSFDGNMREDIGFSVSKSLDIINTEYLNNIKKDKGYSR